MNNLHRELAPISDAAWAQIEEEASRTLKRHLAARRVVDVKGPKGAEFPAVGTGHLRPDPGAGRRNRGRAARGQGARRAARSIRARAPGDRRRRARRKRFRLGPAEGGGTQDRVCRRSRCFRRICRRRNSGHPSGHQQPGVDTPVQRQGLSGRCRAGGEPIAAGRRQRTLYAPARRRAVHRDRRWQRRRLSGPATHRSPCGRRRSSGRRPSRAALCSPPVAATSSWTIGQDLSIGYLSHSATTVQLYFQETFTFLMLTSEASVALALETKTSA